MQFHSWNHMIGMRGSKIVILSICFHSWNRIVRKGEISKQLEIQCHGLTVSFSSENK